MEEIESPLKVLFVCLGNICRSPAGENVMRHLLEEEGLTEEIELDSAGTIGFHTGNPPDHRMTQAARARGINMTGRARQVRASDLEDFDWVLAMDYENYEELKRLQTRTPGATARIIRFCEFCEEHDEEEVPDPYYGGAAGFEKVLDLLEDGCSAFLRRYREDTLS